uniref:Coiled-coil domain containing 127b n=1 Tax=Cyprinus carpio TaxID=7962 RepID=A0A8C1V1Z9_CYPCA
MNDLNDPQGWNIRPERQDGGDSSKWNYALLVPMLGLAAFRMYYTTLLLSLRVDLVQAVSKENNRSPGFSESKIQGRTLGPGKGKKKQEQTASAVLKEVEYRLMKRQEMFCSNLVHYSWNVKMEDKLLNFAAKHPLLAQLKVVDDPRRNGWLMWLYLRYWQLQVTLQTHQRAELSFFIFTFNNLEH